MSRSVNVYIAGNIVYVSGTVNSKAYTWTLTGDHVWGAEVARSTDDVYEIEIQATNSAGTVQDLSTVIYYGLHLITDRIGGFYNASDLNRVGAALRYINGRLTECGFNISITAKANWTISDIPNLSQMTTYIDEIKEIRGVLAVLPTTPNVPPSMSHLTAEKANDIEKILKDVDWLISNMVAAYYYSGELYSGEV